MTKTCCDRCGMLVEGPSNVILQSQTCGTRILGDFCKACFDAIAYEIKLVCVYGLKVAKDENKRDIS